MVFDRQSLRLRGCQAAVCEHASLGQDVGPFSGRLMLHQEVVQTLAHGSDPTGHDFDIALPLCEELRITADQSHLLVSRSSAKLEQATYEIGAEPRRTRDLPSVQPSKVLLYPSRRFLVAASDMQRS